jgi:hypothetical protein
MAICAANSESAHSQTAISRQVGIQGRFEAQANLQVSGQVGGSGKPEPELTCQHCGHWSVAVADAVAVALERVAGRGWW